MKKGTGIFMSRITVASEGCLPATNATPFEELKRPAFKRAHFQPRSFFYESSEQSKRKYDRIKRKFHGGHVCNRRRM